jgi:hypothetical protein
MRRARQTRKKGRTRRKRSLRTLRVKGGFYPSVMGSFVAAASKYVVPIALFAGYRLMKKGTKRRTASKRV